MASPFLARRDAVQPRILLASAAQKLFWRRWGFANENLAVPVLSLADSCRDGFTRELWVSGGRTIRSKSNMIPENLSRLRTPSAAPAVSQYAVTFRALFGYYRLGGVAESASITRGPGSYQGDKKITSCHADLRHCFSAIFQWQPQATSCSGKGEQPSRLALDRFATAQ
jgi:hypothetical protein